MTTLFSRFGGLLAASVSVTCFAQPANAQTAPPIQPAPAAPQTPAPQTPGQNPVLPTPQTPALQAAPVQTPPAEAPPQQQPTRPTRPPVVPPVNLPPQKPVVKLPANIAARVGGQNITREDVLRMVEMNRGREYVSALIDVVVLEQEAKRLGVIVSETELKQEIAKEKERVVQMAMMQGTPMTFSEIQKREGISDDLLRWSVRLRLLQRKAFTKAVQNSVPSRDSQVKLAHILIATVPLSAPGEQVKEAAPDDQKKRDADAKTRIDQILADIKSGKRTWDEAAKDSDDKANGYKGGELDFYSKGQLDPAFEQAGFNIKNVGEIVGPVKSRFGYHIIKLVQRGKDLPAKEKAVYRKQQVEQLLANQQVLNNWINSLRADKNIVRNPDVKLVPGLNMALPALAKPPVRKAALR